MNVERLSLDDAVKYFRHTWIEHKDEPFYVSEIHSYKNNTMFEISGGYYDNGEYVAEVRRVQAILEEFKLLNISCGYYNIGESTPVSVERSCKRQYKKGFCVDTYNVQLELCGKIQEYYYGKFQPVRVDLSTFVSLYHMHKYYKIAEAIEKLNKYPKYHALALNRTMAISHNLFGKEDEYTLFWRTVPVGNFKTIDRFYIINNLFEQEVQDYIYRSKEKVVIV